MVIKFSIWVLKEIINRAEEHWYSPQVIKQELANIQFLWENQEISEEVYHEQEQLLFGRLMEGRERRLKE